MLIKKGHILHECKESKDGDRLLTTSMMGEFINDENENSIRNPLYSKKIQNTTKEKIEEITFQNYTTQHEQKPKQLEIHMNTNMCVIEVTKNLESMKNIKQIEPNQTNDMNIINEIQNNTKQWNHDLNHLQNQTLTETIEII
jgi:hypothetical protein